jgi:hypothetical protein
MTGHFDKTGAAAADHSEPPAVRVYALTSDAPRRIPDEALPMTAQLLSNLEVDRVVELFAHALASRLGFDSFVYQHDESGFSYSSGLPARHALTYRLVLGEQRLGEFTVTRRSRFGSDEIRRVENQICGLVLALHNAWRYQDALARQAA